MHHPGWATELQQAQARLHTTQLQNPLPVPRASSCAHLCCVQDVCDAQVLQQVVAVCGHGIAQEDTWQHHDWHLGAAAHVHELLSKAVL
jgi:hypothetical protein